MKRKTRIGAGFARIGAAFLAAIAFVVLLVPATARADQQLTHGFLRYEIEDNSITIVDYTGDEEEVWVPAYIAGKPVNRVAMGAFYDNWTVRKIYLPDTVTSADEGAFAEDQEVIFDWNVGRGGSEGDDEQAKPSDTPTDQPTDKSTGQSANANGNANANTASPDANTVRNTGTSTTNPASAASRTSTASTSDATNYALPATVALLATAVIGATTCIHRRSC